MSDLEVLMLKIVFIAGPILVVGGLIGMAIMMARDEKIRERRQKLEDAYDRYSFHQKKL